MKKPLSLRTFILLTGLLVLLDQIIKLIIYRWFFTADVPILFNFVRFSPMQNTSLSWFGSLGVGVFANLFITVVLNIIVLYIASAGYAYLRKYSSTPALLPHIIFCMLLAGAVCSLIDKTLWGGSIDYIQLVGLFTFDLKDCYLSGSAVLVCVSTLLYKKELDSFRISDFFRFALNPAKHTQSR